MTIQQALKVSSTTEQMPGVGDGQSLKCAASSFTSAAALQPGDVVQGALVQAGSVIVDVVVMQSGMGAAGAFSVGYGGNPAYWSAAASGVTGGPRRADAPTAQPLVLTTNDTMDVAITAAGATAGVTYTILTYFLPRNA